MSTLAIHLSAMYLARLGSPPPDQIAAGIEHATAAVLADADRLAAEHGAHRVIVAMPGRGEPMRRKLAPAWTQARDEGGHSERPVEVWRGLDALAQQLEELGAEVVAPAPYPAERLLDLGGGECHPVAGTVASGRDVLATLAAQHVDRANGSILRLVTTRPSVAAYLTPGVVEVALLIDGRWTTVSEGPQLAAWKRWPGSEGRDGKVSVPRALLPDYEALCLVEGVAEATALALLRDGNSWRGAANSRGAVTGSALLAVVRAAETGERLAVPQPQGRSRAVSSTVVERLRALGQRGARELIAACALHRCEIEPWGGPSRGAVELQQEAAAIVASVEELLSDEEHGPGVVVTSPGRELHAAHTQGGDVAPADRQAEPDRALPATRAHQGSDAQPRPAPSTEPSATVEGPAEGPAEGPSAPLRAAVLCSRDGCDEAAPCPRHRDVVADLAERLAPPTTTTDRNPKPEKTKPMSDTSNDRRTQPRNAPPPRQEPPRSLGPKAARAERIKAIFRDQAKALAGCFPADGMTMVTRACFSAVAIAAGMKLDVTAESICAAALAALHLGLEPGTDCYVYPYGQEAKLTVGPQGLIKLAMRSGFVEAISARPVFAGDAFDYDFGTGLISHRKAEADRRPWVDGHPVPEADLITHAYAIVYMRGGAKTFEVLTAEDIGFYRSFSKANKGPWFDNFGGMARKTAIKRALALVPLDALTAGALRETEEGAYQLPVELDDIIERAIARRDGRAEQGPPAEDVLGHDVPIASGEHAA